MKLTILITVISFALVACKGKKEADVTTTTSATTTSTTVQAQTTSATK